MKDIVNLMEKALAETMLTCILRVEMNQNTQAELEPIFEWCLQEMEQIIINKPNIHNNRNQNFFFF